MGKRTLQDQVGGTHYQKGDIQPIEFSASQDNIIDAGCFNINKYIQRHPDKNGAQDVKKAADYAKIMKMFVMGELGSVGGITVERFADANQMDEQQRTILRLTNHVLSCHKSGHTVDQETLDLLIDQIEKYGVKCYG